MSTVPSEAPYLEFTSRRDGMIYAMDGGLWLHRHVWKGRPMAHLVSTDRERLLRYGAAIGIAASRLQFKPLRDPGTGPGAPPTCLRRLGSISRVARPQARLARRATVPVRALRREIRRRGPGS